MKALPARKRLPTSDNPGNADEYLDGSLPAGDYYWFMVAKTATNAQFSFGVAVDTNIDAFEPNDTPESAFALPDSMNKVTANLDNANDVDYFDFKAVRGQSVSMYLAGDENGSRNQWLFERFDGANWVTVPAGSTSTYPSVTPGTTVKVRVRANPGVAQDPAKQYALSLGSTPRLNASDVKGDNIVRVPASIFWMATQAARTLNWTTHWSDSTGAPLLGVTPVLRVDKRFVGAEYHWTDFMASTNSVGTVPSMVFAARSRSASVLLWLKPASRSCTVGHSSRCSAPGCTPIPHTSAKLSIIRPWIAAAALPCSC